MKYSCDCVRIASILITVIVMLSSYTICEADQQIFFQDFESGLGINESTSGVFAINNTNVNNNSTLMMGHPTAYGSNDHSTYELMVNLTIFASATMTFDFLADLENALMDENRPDGFAVRANPIEDSPPPDIIFPTANSDMQYVFHPPAVNNPFHQVIGPDYYDESATAGGSSGTAEFNLDAFAGGLLTLRFQFNSDNSVHDDGFNLDNLEIRGVLDDADDEIPEPASFALSAMGLAGLVLMFRRQSRMGESPRPIH